MSRGWFYRFDLRDSLYTHRSWRADRCLLPGVWGREGLSRTVSAQSFGKAELVTALKGPMDRQADRGEAWEIWTQQQWD